MPKRTDLKKILIIGSGPIVIGQACEFDYSGTQACRALKEEGYQVALVNSNPATIMTDPDFADSTYIEPLNVEFLEEIIIKEKPCAVLPTLGGQTALNLALDLDKKQIFKKYNVEVLGAKPDVIEKAENRDLFKQAMKKIGLDTAHSEIAHSIEEANIAREKINSFPLIIRPSFTLGGSGGGIAYNQQQFQEICKMGLEYSPTNEILIEESILGWKEFELEVVRDKFDNCIVVCSIENLDPMGVHTGDSITVAPIQTLTDKQYQLMRTKSIEVIREIGVETGGSNVQWAINPQNGRMIIIEMNPRVSRSSALASKATGFPIAKVASKLAVGYSLDELQNDITKTTSACFEPSLDYVVTKIPRFNFEKFPGTDTTLNTQMKSVGEAMSIGRTFKESFQKAIRSLEINHYGFGADNNDCEYEKLDDKSLEEKIKNPNAYRIFYIRVAIKRNWSLEKIYQLSKIDYWFLNHFHELVHFEQEIKKQGIEKIKKDKDFLIQVKQFGYSDKQLAYLLNSNEKNIRNIRYNLNVIPNYNLVDTCSGEFKAQTPYYYSSYCGVNESQEQSNKKSVLIIGSGPNRIGQGVEFDYCCVHCSLALKEMGYNSVMVNSNPETVSTDYDVSSKLYFEPLNLEDILHIYNKENCIGVIIQFGGQTPLNIASELQDNNVNILGTSPQQIENAEDRKFFQKLAKSLNIKQPLNDIAYNLKQAQDIAEKISYPVLVRPSFVLGGRAMAIVYNQKELDEYMQKAIKINNDKSILIDKFLDDALELDVDCLSDGEESIVIGIMEHVERAGIHSGDSACIFPAISIPFVLQEKIKKHCTDLAKELKVIGVMNIQFAIKDQEIYIIEVNPRASRTIPYLSKSVNIALAKYATFLIMGKKLKDFEVFNKEITSKFYSIKESVFPFVRFPNIDIVLSPEMKSTGEVMGMSESPGIAFLKAQQAAFNPIPKQGAIVVSVKDDDKVKILDFIKELFDMGFKIYATNGTRNFLTDNSLEVEKMAKIDEGYPDTLDLIKENKINWIINTPSGSNPQRNEVEMRTSAITYGIPITTAIPALALAVRGLKEIKDRNFFITNSLQS